MTPNSCALCDKDSALPIVRNGSKCNRLWPRKHRGLPNYDKISTHGWSTLRSILAPVTTRHLHFQPLVDRVIPWPLEVILGIQIWVNKLEQQDTPTVHSESALITNVGRRKMPVFLMVFVKARRKNGEVVETVQGVNLVLRLRKASYPK